MIPITTAPDAPPHSGEPWCSAGTTPIATALASTNVTQKVRAARPARLRACLSSDEIPMPGASMEWRALGGGHDEPDGMVGEPAFANLAHRDEACPRPDDVGVHPPRGGLQRPGDPIRRDDDPRGADDNELGVPPGNRV